MSKGNAFSFWQKKEEGSHKTKYLSRSSSTASELLSLRKSNPKKTFSPLAKKEEEERKGRNNPKPIEVEKQPSVEEDGSPELRRRRYKPAPAAPQDGDEEELRKFVRKSIRRIKRESRAVPQERVSLLPPTIPELDPVEVDEEEVEEMLPLVKDLLAGGQIVSDEEEDHPDTDAGQDVPIVIDVKDADEDPTNQKIIPIIAEQKSPENEQSEENAEVDKDADQDLQALLMELENADNLDLESLRDILKRSHSALTTMIEKTKRLESQLKDQAPLGLPSPSPSPSPSGPPPPPPPAPPPSLMAVPKPLVIRKGQGRPQQEKIAAGPPQVDMMAEMRKMMARRNERKSLRVKYTHLDK